MEKDTKYLRLFFDLDNTLTRSRSAITPEMKTLLQSLMYDIVVISGATVDQIRHQLDGLACYTLGQNGNHAMHGDIELWRDELTPEDLAEIDAHIASLPRVATVPDENDLTEKRGSQVSYSIYGHHAPVAIKEKVDSDQALRVGLLAQHPLISDRVEVKIGGTTCLDYFKKGRNKGYNVTRLAEYMSWNLDTCLYFGDALFPGGNDETVIGIIDTESVRDPEDTYQKLLALKK